MKLRKYQSEAVEYVEASAAFGSTKIIIDAPTGSGKSLMISELCKRFSHERINILVNVSKLVGQISKHLTEVGVDHSILKSGMEDDYDESKRVQIFMEQTYDKRKDKISAKAGIIIRDEHHIGFTGTRFNSIVSAVRPKLIVGFSATPYDSYGVALPGYELATFADIKKLTKDGYLMDAQTFVPRFGQQINLSKIGKSSDYSESELDDLLNNDEYNSSVADEYVGWFGRKAILFVSGTQHAEDMTKMFQDKGIKAMKLHSKMTKVEQATAMDSFQGRAVFTTDVLITVSMLTTGFDMPECSMVINCRPTKVRSLYVQMIGRVLRPHWGDPLMEAVILDCCRATTEHGLYDEPFTIHKDRVSAKTERKRRSEPIIDYISAKHNKTISITIGLLAKEYKDVFRDDSTNAMVWIFENVDDVRDLLGATANLYRKFHKMTVKQSTIDWVMEEVGPAMKWMSLNTIRNRLRKMLMEKKKFGGIRSYPKWFKANILGGY